MRLVGYARVSTGDQDTRMQLDALRKAGVDQLHSEACSGIGLRPVLRSVLAGLGKGDVLVVWKIDRIARGLPDLLRIVELLKSQGAGIRSLTEPMDTSVPLGEFMIQMLGSFAQLERSMIRERVIAGQVAAIMRGAAHGRPKLLSQAEIGRVLEMRRDGLGKPTIAKLYGVSRGVIDRIVAQSENPTHPKFGPNRPVLGPLIDAATR